MVRYARRERDSLADALTAVAPDAPTLCTGWTARDLAAHIVLRDRRPIAAAGIILKPLRGLNERVQRRIAERNYDDLVATVRSAPRLSPLSLRPLDEVTNTVEFFIHTEDVRRAGPGWQPRALDPGLTDLLWNRLGGMAKMTLRRFPARVELVAPGRPPIHAGAKPEGANPDTPPPVQVRGEPGELVLFLSGRQDAARVEVIGRADLVAKLRGASLGV
jgi:uncharacterized protein (TIGR03085 family)